MRRGATGRRRSASSAFHAAEPNSKTPRASSGVSRASAKTPTGDLATKLRALHRSLKSRVGQREALVDMLSAVNSSLDPFRIADLVLERAVTWVPASSWGLFSADLSGQLSLIGERGLSPDMTVGLQSIARWVMEHGVEFMTADLGRDPRLSHDAIGSVVAFPLSCRDRHVGALISLDRQTSRQPPRLSVSVTRAIGQLLEPAAAAIDNALLLKRAEALSVTDDLTHLYNSRFLNLVLRREEKRARRSGRPLSLLFIDLDGFKTINDQHGHLSGSRALVEAAAVIRGSSRETDAVARFGGDEFALVLPETGGDGAFAVGERIRERIAGHTFLASEGLDIHLTASVGVATLPAVASSAEELVQAADRAMYQVKQSGKNGIRAAAPPADT
jgi:diguanylate cyclase (GGDEF)-like protein